MPHSLHPQRPSRQQLGTLGPRNAFWAAAAQTIASPGSFHVYLGGVHISAEDMAVSTGSVL